MDEDGDGFDITEDCEPQNPDVGIYVWHADADLDGYPNEESQVAACDPPAETGWVLADDAVAGDCDDAAEAINPGATEMCDGLDNDCDDQIDDEDDSVSDKLDWYADADSDDYGDADSLVSACYQPDGFVAVSGDCDDTAAEVYPDAMEICDGLDNDCDELTIEDATATLNGAENFTDLQEAIDAAKGLTDPEILVCSGTWEGAYSISDDLTLTAVHGIKETVLDARGLSASVIKIQDAEVRIEGFSITNGMGTESEGGGRLGGGVYAIGMTRVTLTDCDIYDNNATRGGGVAAAEANVTVIGGNIRNNSAAAEGGGYFGLEQDHAFDGTNINDNDAINGGGIFLNAPRTTAITATLRDNIAYGSGGGIMVVGGTANIMGSLIKENTAPQGGGAYFDEVQGLEVGNTTFSTNDANTDGGGVLSNNSRGSMVDVTITANTATSGAGLYVSGTDESLSIDGSSINNNVATSAGGGVLVYGSTLELANTSVTSNSAVESCEVDLPDINLSVGGGISVQDGGSLDAVGATVVSANEACGGGGVHLANGAEFNGGSITGNSAIFGGGGVAIADLSGPSQGEINETLIASNTSDIGGGILVLGELDATSVVLDNNSAGAGGGLYLLGVITPKYNVESEAILRQCTLTSNEATSIGNGGGAHLIHNARIESQSTDWGSDEADNVDDDLVIEKLVGTNRYDDLGDDESFTCNTTTGCP